MNRRKFLLNVSGVMAGLVLLATPAKANGIADANEFALAYANWGKLYEHRNPSELDLHEVRAWREVKDRFSTMRKHIDQEYAQ